MSKALDTTGSYDLPEHDDEERQQPFVFPENTRDLLALDIPNDWIFLEWGGYRDAAEYHGPLHDAYEASKSSFGTKAAAFRAWREMKFPRLGGPHTDAFVNSSKFGNARSGEYRASTRNGRIYASFSNPAWMSCLAHPDGSGIVTYGGEVAYVRTKNRLLLKASEDLKKIQGGPWYASYRSPPACRTHDGTVPLVNLEELDDTPPLVDITRYEKGGPKNGKNVYVYYDDGTVVVVLNDATANSRDNRKAGFVLAPEEAAETTLPPVGEAERLVMPATVEARYLEGTEVVTSDEYASRTSYHTADGWQHRDTGDHIIRQGEWYLVPKTPWWSPDQPIYKPLPNAERAVDWKYDHLCGDDYSVRKETGECLCGSTRWHLPERGPVYVCKECEAVFVSTGKRLVRVEEPANRSAFTDAADRLDSHKPRDLSLDSDGTPVVRGTFRHIDNEHAMLNVVDRWHEVHENTRDMTVFSYRRGNYASGGRSGGMRVE